MDGSFVTAITEAAAKPTVILDRTLAPASWKDLTPDIPAPEALECKTLTGLRDYIAANRDGLTLSDLALHVYGPHRVDLIAPIGDEKMEYARHRYAAALMQHPPFPFGQYLDAEEFFIALQTRFTDSPDRATLIELVASIRESDVRDTLDNGVGQEVKTQRGIALADRTRVPNPVLLAPWRTFRELAQPASLFVLRLRSAGGPKPTAALFEADGGAWQLEAIDSVATWLRANVVGVPVIA